MAKEIVTASVAYEKMLESFSSKPTVSSSGLGSQTASPVIVHTGQSIYTHIDLNLKGSYDLSIKRTYISRESHIGLFGLHWFTMYEHSFKTYTHNNKNIKRLSLSDGRKFDFSFNEDVKSYEDVGNLGLEVKIEDNNTFILEYFNGKREKYINDKLICIEENNNITKLFYDKNNFLIKCTNSSGHILEFFYNKNNLVYKVQDQSKRIYEYFYDANKNLLSVKNPQGNDKTFYYIKFYEKNRKNSYLLEKIIDESNKNEIEFTYDEKARVNSYQIQEKIYNYEYEENLINKTSNIGNDISYQIDDYGLISAISTDKTFLKEEYDVKTKTATIFRGDENIELKVFDKRNRLISHTVNDIETVYTYEGKNYKASSIINENNEIFNTYDEKYNLIKNIDDNKIISYEYDKNKNIISHINEKNEKTTYTYNELNQLVKEENSDGSFLFEYDSLHRVIKSYDKENRVRIYSYDSLDNLIKNSQVLDEEKDQYSYDPETLMATYISNSAGNIDIFYEYDKASRLEKIIDPTMNEIIYTYDKHGRANSETINDRAKNARYLKNNSVSSVNLQYDTNTKLFYNDKKQIVKKQVNDELSRYEYNENNKLIKIQSKKGDIEFSYDEKGNLISQIQDGITLKKFYSSPCDGNVLKSYTFLKQEVVHKRDDDNNLIKVSLGNKSLVRFKYHDLKIKSREYTNNLNEVYTYHNNKIIHINTANKTFVYTYDKSSLITNINNHAYSYDNNQRLIKDNDEIYSYDKAGNLLNNNSIYKNNELLENKDFFFSYDKRGNLKSKISKTNNDKHLYTFNDENQLIKLLVQDKKQNTINELDFTYDALNRRVSKKVNSIIHHYIYDGFNIIAILDENKKVISNIIHDELIDTPLTITTNNETFFYHRNHQGSIVALSDEEGEIVESFIYNAYGKIISHYIIKNTNNPYAYTAREYDLDDLYYYRFRYYDSNIKRFLSLDPFSHDDGDFNHYRYVENNPLNFLDPFGLKKDCNKEKTKGIIRKKGMKSTLKKVAGAILFWRDGPFPIRDSFGVTIVKD